MTTRQHFDTILHTCCERMRDDVTALIGKPFHLGEPRCGQFSRAALFAELGGKQVLAHVQIEGDIEGAGCLLVGTKDAIVIGGTLIMLPESEIESMLADLDYSEEVQDSFGEIANILCGAVTVVMGEQFPKTVRLVRTEQEVVIPAKVESAADKLLADIPYYQMVVPMRLADRELGDLRLVLPAACFGLVDETVKEGEDEPAAITTTNKAQCDSSVVDEVGVLERPQADSGAGEAAVLERPAPNSATGLSGIPSPTGLELDSQKRLIDELFCSCLARVSEEVSALLGGVLTIAPEATTVVSKGRFLEQAGGRQIMTRMDIRGSDRQEAFLFVNVTSAIYLGSTLIMLPESEIEEMLRNEEFVEDASDAYAEITNIIAGVYTSLFEERYREKLGFVKQAMEPVTPTAIAPETDETFPCQAYCVSQGRMVYNGRDLGLLHLLIPAALLELDDAVQIGEQAVADSMETALKPADASSAHVEHGRLRPMATVAPEVLLFTDDQAEAERITNVVETLGYGCRTLHFKDPVDSALSSCIRMVLVVMRETSEQGFGVAIKLGSAGLQAPLLAAAPAWTRTTVLKAVKYGACDILVTPSAPEEIRQKIEGALVRKAA